MRELYKLLHIEGNPSTAYHPQTDGQTERVNQELEKYLRLYVNHRQTDWSDWLAIAEFAYNDGEHSATKMTPFFVNTGRHPVNFSQTKTSSANLSAEDFAKHIKDVHEQTRKNLVRAAEEMKRYHDRHASPTTQYETGDKVFLDGRNIKTSRPSAKMEDKWFGPFEVLEKVGAAAYRLKIPRSWKKVYPVFNEVLLKPAVEPLFETQKKPPPPPPTIIDDEIEYEVEQVLDLKLHHGKLQYLVKWIGYNEPSWEPEENLEHAKDTVNDFYRLHPGAPRRLSIPRTRLRPIFQYTAPTNMNGWSGRPTLKGG